MVYPCGVGGYLAVGAASGCSWEDDRLRDPFTCPSFIDNRSLPVFAIYGMIIEALMVCPCVIPWYLVGRGSRMSGDSSQNIGCQGSSQICSLYFF